MTRLKWCSPSLAFLLALIVVLPAVAQTGADDRQVQRLSLRETINQRGAIHPSVALANPDTQPRLSA